jgi:hypothetical protein
MNQLDIPENLFVCSLKKIPVSFERTCHTSPPPMMMMTKEFSAEAKTDQIKKEEKMKHSNCFIFISPFLFWHIFTGVFIFI